MVRRAGLSLSVINFSQLVGFKRVDAEYYQPLYELNEKVVGKHKTQTLAEIATRFAKGIFDIRADEYTNEGIPFVRINNLRNWVIDTSDIAFISPEKNKQESKTSLKQYDIILSKTAYPAASIVQVDICNTSQDTIAVRTNQSADFNFYLVAYLNTKFGMLQMKRLFQGNVQTHLSLPDARTIRIPIPPLDFPKKIRKYFEQSFQTREHAKKLYAEAENLLASELGLDKLDLSESLFTVQSVSEVSNSHRADAEYYKRKYSNLLGHIEKKTFSTLEQITSFSGGATPLGADYLEEGIPFLRIQNVGDNRLILDDVAFIDENVHNGLLKRSQIKPDDVLLTITGRIGTSAVVTDDVKTGNINQHIVRMRLNSNEFNPYYLAAFMNSVGGRLQTERESYGTTRDALPYYCLAKIRVLHADMGLQKEIETTIRKAEETNKEAERLLAEAKGEVEKLIEG